jgi:hypothetical protein
MSARKPASSAEMDLAQLRKAKRLLRRALREIEGLEATIVKWRKVDRPKIPTPEEREAVDRLYEPESGIGVLPPYDVLMRGGK